MHHKRGRSKNQRAGCLMCKPNKMSGMKNRDEVFHTGFGPIKARINADADLAELCELTEEVNLGAAGSKD